MRLNKRVLQQGSQEGRVYHLAVLMKGRSHDDRVLPLNACADSFTCDSCSEAFPTHFCAGRLLKFIVLDPVWLIKTLKTRSIWYVSTEIFLTSAYCGLRG